MSNWTQPGYDPSQHSWRKGEIDGKPNGGWTPDYFFADTLRSIDVAFGSFLNGIKVFHYNEEGEPVKAIEIPIKYGPRSKAFDFRVEKETGKKYYIPLPNITYRRTAMEWDSERASGQNEGRMFYSNYFSHNGIDEVMAEKFWSDIQPVPYNITYEVNIKAEYISDMDQLMEQICREFEPDININVKEFWFANIRRCIKVKLESVSHDYTVDYNEDNKRELTSTLTFKAYAYLYKAIEHGTIIDQIIMKLTTQGSAGIEYNMGISGNWNGSLDERYDFSKAFGTKIGYASAVIPNESLPVWNEETSSYFTKYNYMQLDELINYPWGATQLFAVSSIFDPNSATYSAISADRKTATSAVVSAYDPSATYTYTNDLKYNTSNSSTIFTVSKNLSGFGNFIGNDISFKSGIREVDLGTEIVTAAPFVQSAAEVIINNSN